MRIAIILTFGFYFTISAYATCTPNSSLDELINDPDLKKMLQQPIRPRIDAEESPIVSPRDQIELDIEQAKADLAAINKKYDATPAEVRAMERRVDSLVSRREQLDVEESISRVEESEGESDFFKLIMGQEVKPSTRATGEDVAIDLDKLRRLDPEYKDSAIDELIEERELPPITQQDRDEFAALLKQPMITRSQRNPYDNFISDVRASSPSTPISAKKRDPITGKVMDVDVVEYVDSVEFGDMVKIRLKNEEGRIIHKVVRADSLQYEGVDLRSKEGIFNSSKFADLDESKRAEAIVDGMGRDAITKTDQEEYQRLQKLLDSRQLTIDEMIDTVGRQDDIVRKYSPLREHEIQTIEDNLEGLLSGEGTRLSASDKRAIEHIREIIDHRDGNPRSIEDKALFDRVGNLSEKSILEGRITKARSQAIAEMRRLSGAQDFRNLPFELSRKWSSSSIRSEIGSVAGRTKTIEALRTVSNFERSKQILGNDEAREMTMAIRELESTLRSRSATGGPSTQYLEYLKLRVKHYELNFKLEELKY